MKFSRLTLAASLSAALVLTSCTGADESPEGTTSGPASTSEAGATETSAATTDGDEETTSGDVEDETAGATGAQDDEGSTAGPEDEGATAAPGDSTEMTTDAEAADLPLKDAEEIATKVLAARNKSLRAEIGQNFRAGRDASTAGSAKTAASAAFALRSVNGKSEEGSSTDFAEPNVLAISRADDDASQLILVQTVPGGDGVPLLHLLASNNGKKNHFRIVWEAPMLPGTTIPTFDRRSVGSPVVLKGKGDLVESPRETLKKLAGYISWPQPDETPDYRTHGYSPAVRKAAETQAAAVSGLASLREKNWLVSDDVKTLLFEDGSALVTGTLLRDTTFTVNSGSVLTAPEAFTVLADKDSLNEEAVLRTMVFVAMRVPAKDNEFKPEMLAAREQLVDAWGS